MPITAPPTIPLITDPSTFATRAQDWVVWQAEQLYPELGFQAGLLGLSLSATSVTSNTVGTGSKSFTVETGKGFVEGVSLSIADANTPTNRMFVVVTSYNSGTGELIVTSQAFEGSGTYTDWQIAPSFSALSTPLDNSVSTVKIQDNAVTEDKIADDVVASFKTQKLYDFDATVASNDLTVTVNAGVWDFRSTTLTDGTPVTRTLSSPVSVVVPNGATLGTINAIAARLVVLLIDNAGTLEAAIVNLAGGNKLDESNLINTTTIGTGSDSNNVIYSTTGRTGVAYRVIGFIDITEATAGTWATAPTLVQGGGGQALAALSSLGYGQTWQNLIGSRVSNTIYYNTTGKPISVVARTNSDATSQLDLYINENLVDIAAYNGGGTGIISVSGIVPANASYRVVQTVTVIDAWWELR